MKQVVTAIFLLGTLAFLSCSKEAPKPGPDNTPATKTYTNNGGIKDAAGKPITKKLQ